MQLSLEVIAGHGYILMTCWADNSFLAMYITCTNLDAQKSACGFLSGNQKSSPLANLGNFCNKNMPLMKFLVGIYSMRQNPSLPPFLLSFLPLFVTKPPFFFISYLLSLTLLTSLSASNLPVVCPVFSKEFKGS